MRTLILLLFVADLGQGDFSYVATIKSVAPAFNTTEKYAIKGNLEKHDFGSYSLIYDLDAQTLTTIDHAKKSYTIQALARREADLQKSGANLEITVKETGQKKLIGGFTCRQIFKTITGNVQGMATEVEMWISSDVPGAVEFEAFRSRMILLRPNSNDRANQSKQSFADFQAQQSKLIGVPVLQITRMMMLDSEMSRKAAAEVQAVRLQIEALKKEGGKKAEDADKAAAYFGISLGGKYVSEITSESSGFSTETISASEFAVPADYKKVDR